MIQGKLNVEVLDLSENALSIICAACRQCYSPKFAAQIFKDGMQNGNGPEEFVKQIVLSGHGSPLEHGQFAFAIEGVSRALTHQLVRHRIASYSQQSQRYVKESDFDYVTLPSIEEDEDLKSEYIDTLRIQNQYAKA